MFFSAKTQVSPYVLLKTMEQKSVLMEVDMLGNIYLSDGFVLYMYDKNFQLKFTYSDFFSGSMSTIDVSNPMKIWVFSQDFMLLTVLNNQLVKQNNTYRFSDWNIMLPKTICASYDNGFWVYDAMKDALFRFDAFGKKIIESQSLHILIDKKITVDGMREIGGKYLIINSEKYGLFVFDKFGTYIKYIPTEGVKSFSVWNTKIVYVLNEKIEVFDIETLDKQIYPLPQSDIQRVVIHKQYLITLSTSGEVKMYGIADLK